MNTQLLPHEVTPELIVLLRSALLVILLVLAIYYLINIGNTWIERSRRIEIDLKLVARICGVLFGIYVLRAIFNHFPIIGNTIGSLFIAIILAYVMNPLVTYLEGKNIKRRYGVLIVYASLALILVLVFVVVLPKTVSEFRAFFMEIPSYLDTWSKGSQEWLQKFESVSNLNLEQIENEFNSGINKLLTNAQTGISDKIKDIPVGINALFSRLISIMLVLIFSFYFCVDKDHFKDIVYRLLPRKHKTDILYLGGKINNALLEFVKGRLLMALFVGLMTMIVLLILRVDFAIIIGLVTCVADIIPYVGPFLALLPAVLFAALDSTSKALWVAIIFVLIQWAENNLLGPKILGSKTGLHPLVVLLAIVIGGGMFGFIGMILSVPFVSVCLILKDFALMKIHQRQVDKDLH